MNGHYKLLKGNHGFEQTFNQISRKLGLFGTKLYILNRLKKQCCSHFNQMSDTTF